jgi:hypothetical protein
MSKGTVGVRLRRDWFAPDGSLYQARDNPHEFPAHYADKPKQKEDETDEDFKARQKRQPFEILPSTAEVIDEGKSRTVAVLQDTANGEKLVVPTLVDDDVKEVGGALDDKGLEQPAQSVAEAEKGAEAQNVSVGGVPRKSGPLPAAASDKKK